MAELEAQPVSPDGHLMAYAALPMNPYLGCSRQASTHGRQASPHGSASCKLPRQVPVKLKHAKALAHAAQLGHILGHCLDGLRLLLQELALCTGQKVFKALQAFFQSHAMRYYMQKI